MATSIVAPAASVADTGAGAGGAPSPSADLDTSLGTSTGAEDAGGGAAAGSGAGDGTRSAESAAADSKTDAGGDKGTPEEGSAEDGRAIPAKWREAFKNDPELKSLFFERRAFQKEFPGGLEEARGLKQTLDLVGGAAGLEQLQTDFSDFRNLANQFLDGDPEYVNDIFEADPVAALSHLPAYLEKCQEADAPSFNREIAKRFTAELVATNFRPTLKAIFDLVDTDPAQAKKLLNGMAGWNDRIKELAEKEDDPRVKQLQERERDRRKSDDETAKTQANNEYRRESNQAAFAEATRLFDSLLKGRKLDREDRVSVMKLIMKTTDERILADREFMAKHNKILKAGKKSAALTSIKSRWEKELAITVPKHIRLFALGDGKPAGPDKGATGNGQRPAATGAGDFAMVDSVPAAKTIDYSQTTQDMIVKEHRAILKGGKKVKWALAG